MVSKMSKAMTFGKVLYKVRIALVFLRVLKNEGK